MAKKQSWLEEHQQGCRCRVCKEDAVGRVAHYSDGEPVCINCDAKIEGLIDED